MPTKLILVPSAEQAGDAGTGHSNKDCQAARPRAGAQALRGCGEGGGSGRTRRPSQSQNITDMGCPSLPTRAPLGRTQQVEAEGSSGGSRPRSQVPTVLSGFCWEPRSTRPQAGPPPPSSFQRLCPDDLLLGQSVGLPLLSPWPSAGAGAGPREGPGLVGAGSRLRYNLPWSQEESAQCPRRGQTQAVGTAGRQGGLLGGGGALAGIPALGGQDSRG